MRLSTALVLAFIVFSVQLYAQVLTTDVKVEEVLVKESIYLKGPFHQSINAGIQNRKIFEIDIPKNTIYLLYGYTTASGNTKPESLNLKSQITKATRTRKIIDSDLFSNLMVPAGKVEFNLYLVDESNRDKFLNFQQFMDGDYRYITEGSRLDKSHDLIVLDNQTEGALFLIFDFVNKTRSMNANLEVVAITDSSSKNLETLQLEALNLAEKGELAFDKQEFAKALDYSQRSFEVYQLGWVQANIGLAELALDNPNKALETYKESVQLIMRQPNSVYILEKLDKDLKTLKQTRGAINGIEPIERLIALFRE
ncbi:tetratricopeptide repeat protein [Psychroserpens sp.]|uniref:tetratricopeptide repeat protein n=1 Tax=Psychroserpens sp. TaxID=2020870 RepID=UPI001B089266|nr:tetratricopeptide repeat protein [Psychroserpens sp.]MBO6606434.1 tetratricopeptide repeat protein [Psychroserpens sp.]MBO6653138.1 tetratricopeptide repeat protein [Psychroserpens sp.]MBO6680834.1 tetratricopeptide repeat protein [Psychroserpens sp.]MBO6750208.1 tetratricopeptide repeat protein [Psychroserpens sp.]MBO6914689.1 tetratricopeptide repeat protein [Psychroserpens sp.]